MMAAVIINNAAINRILEGTVSRLYIIPSIVFCPLLKARSITPILRRTAPKKKNLWANFDASLASPHLESTPIKRAIKIPIANQEIKKGKI
jgi:hypothetical protein